MYLKAQILNTNFLLSDKKSEVKIFIKKKKK